MHIDQIWIDLIVGVGGAIVGWFLKHFSDNGK